MSRSPQSSQYAFNIFTHNLRLRENESVKEQVLLWLTYTVNLFEHAAKRSTTYFLYLLIEIVCS